MNKSRFAPVSVIIPCYRCKDTIEQTFKSVLKQTLQPAEILLIDDASGDGTLEVLKQLEQDYAQKVRIIPLQQNGGPGLARNAGWDAATQPWLAFLDADDVWHPRKLEIQWGWLEDHQEVSLCGHTSLLCSENIDDFRPIEPFKVSRLTPLIMLISNRLPTRSVMLRRDLPFRFGDKNVTEDYLMWLEIILAKFPACRLETCLVFSLRPEFSHGGYSGQLWVHEQRELAALKLLWMKGKIALPVLMMSLIWSYVKFLRRMWLRRNK